AASGATPSALLLRLGVRGGVGLYRHRLGLLDLRALRLERLRLLLGLSRGLGLLLPRRTHGLLGLGLERDGSRELLGFVGERRIGGAGKRTTDRRGHLLPDELRRAGDDDLVVAVELRDAGRRVVEADFDQLDLDLRALRDRGWREQCLELALAND